MTRAYSHHQQIIHLDKQASLNVNKSAKYHKLDSSLSRVQNVWIGVDWTKEQRHSKISLHTRTFRKYNSVLIYIF